MSLPADVLHYRHLASEAVARASREHPSAAYGYLSVDARQKVLLFSSADDARAWHGHLAPDYDYAVAFAAADLQTPIAEDLGARPVVSGCFDPQVGHWFGPLALGIPAGALGGYFYRKWQEAHPGKWIPWISGENVGAWPWYSIEDPAGPHFLQRGPWIDIVGAEVDAHRRVWPTAKALIRSATDEVLAADRYDQPGVAYVWSLETYGDTQIVPFASYAQALAHARERAQTPHVALASFDKTSRHWPHPMTWTKSDAPEGESAIAAQLAKHAPARAAGDVVGALPWYTIIGQALDVLRRQARAAAEGAIAERVPGRYLGVLRDARGRWKLKTFRSEAAAEDWFERETGSPSRFTYAAYFDKEGTFAPTMLNESIGGGTYSPVAGHLEAA